jgi:3-mercaptopyruvate sulfurtransferase SseA
LAESRPGLVPEPELNPRPIGRPLLRTVFIRMDEAKKQFDLGVQFFDARVKAVFEATHINGAVNLDPTDPAIVAARSVPPALDRFDRAKTVVVYDDGGDCDAAQLISIQLRKFGFTDVKMFEEGFPAWKAKGYPIGGPR